MKTPPVNTPPTALTTSLEWSTTPPSSAPTWQTALGCLWLAGVLLMLLRAVRILHGERRTAGTSRPVNDPDTLALLDQLRARFQIARRVLIATVDTACSPAVVGIVTPVILVPATILTGSSPDQLRAILAHELAHIHRWDVLTNVLQLLVESLFFHNPFVWLLSAQIRHEREACCDASAAECCGGAPAYARVLVDVGQRVLAASAAISFAHPTSLSDRVRRLLGLRPAGDTWRLPMASLVIGLIAGLSTILLVAQGTFKATDAILSATERIELIEQTVATTQQKLEVKTAIRATRYVGRIATPDGRPLPNETRLFTLTYRPSGRVSSREGIDTKSGRFSTDTKGTSSTLWVEAPGYAPWVEGPMSPGTEAVTDLGLWVLEPQAPLLIRILDKKGQPVSEAEVRTTWHPVKDASFGSMLHTTDSVGECIVPLVTDYPMSLNVTAAGFEPTIFGNLSPQDDTPLTFQLPAGIPLFLRVLDRDTGAPIAGARVRLLAQMAEMAHLNRNQLATAPVVGTCGREGTCTINSFHRNGQYWLIVDAEGHGPELLERVAPGDRLDVHLGPPRVVRGTVTGNLDRLPKRRGKPYLNIRCLIHHTPNGAHGYGFPVPVQIQNGAGTFQTDQLWPGDFDIETGGQCVKFSTESGGADVDVKLRAPNDAREVRLAFVPREDAPLPRGTMRVLFQGYSDPRDLPVENGVVSIRVRTGQQVAYGPSGVVGGWFAPGEIKSVPPGDTPLMVHIPFVPAGAIAVSLVEADGSPAGGFKTRVRELTKSPQRANVRFGVSGKYTSSPDDGVHAFTATPLPLGGTYEVVVSRRFTYVTTGPIRLTEKRPLHKRQFVLAGEATIRGQVVAPKGAPIPGVPIWLSVSLAGTSFRAGGSKTDRNGRFEFKGIVHHRSTTYQVSADPTRGFVPRQVTVANPNKPLRIVTKPGLALSGRVLDEKDGTPLGDLEVFLWRDTDDGRPGFSEFHPEGRTDRKGNFHFSNLLPGTYRLCCALVSRIGNRPRVKAGQAKPVIWRVPKPH